MPSFPRTRLRRNRASSFVRALVAENRVSAADLILPVFVTDAGESSEVASMPGTFRNTLADAAKLAERALSLGVPALALFPEVDPALKTWRKF